MLRPLPDLNDADKLAKLGREYALMNAKRDALHQLRDAVTTLQSPHDALHAEAIKSAREAIERLEVLQAA
jgi:hypothetical protein